MTALSRTPLAVFSAFIHRWIEPIAALWHARDKRERILLVIMGLVLGLAALQMLVVQPALEARARLTAQIADLDRALARTRDLAPLAESERTSVEPAAVRLNRITAEAGLDIARLQTEGTRHTVSLTDAPFSAVADWIATIEQSPSLTITALQLERRPTPGVVSTRAEIEGQG